MPHALIWTDTQLKPEQPVRLSRAETLSISLQGQTQGYRGGLWLPWPWGHCKSQWNGMCDLSQVTLGNGHKVDAAPTLSPCGTEAGKDSQPLLGLTTTGSPALRNKPRSIWGDPMRAGKMFSRGVPWPYPS